MKIVMFTNTYRPHVGGVANSVATLEQRCRQLGHEVRIVAPESEAAEPSPHVLRVPAIQNFNGSDFSVRIPVPTLIRDYIEEFEPDVIHSHHPFLLGDAALREAWKSRIPILFTHHTLYEQYTHYVPLDSPALKRAAIQMATEYCNLCDLVIAPSESIEKLLIERGVTASIEVIPTGIDTKAFAKGNGNRCRDTLGIPRDAKVIGHVGRLAKEKNLAYLANAVALALDAMPDSVFMIVGDGECRDEVAKTLSREVDAGRVNLPGKLTGEALTDAYAAIDCFVFSSQSETQGMVLAEAMAAGSPVVALDGPGVREIVSSGNNGTMLEENASPQEFADALCVILANPKLLRDLSAGARECAVGFDADWCVGRVLQLYEELIQGYTAKESIEWTRWDRVISAIEIEWDLLAARWAAAAAAMVETPATNTRIG